MSNRNRKPKDEEPTEDVPATTEGTPTEVEVPKENKAIMGLRKLSIAGKHNAVKLACNFTQARMLFPESIHNWEDFRAMKVQAWQEAKAPGTRVAQPTLKDGAAVTKAQTALDKALARAEALKAAIAAAQAAGINATPTA